MKVFIMTDVEGTAGVQNMAQWRYPEGRYYSKAKELLTLETNAAIEGFLAGGATEILVADGHGPGAINQEMLHPEAKLVRYWHKGTPSVYLVEGRFDFMAHIGRHPMAGTTGGHLSHTEAVSM